jgi:hypothetical protein
MGRRATKVWVQGGKELKRSQMRGARAERRRSGGEVTLGRRLVPKKGKSASAGKVGLAQLSRG